MGDLSGRSLATRRGIVRLPTFFPVTTFGSQYPLDRLIRPYLPRLCQAVLVSYHYAAHLDENPAEHPDMPLFIDSGGFALLFEGASMSKQDGVFGIKAHSGDLVTPDKVLERQMRNAEIGATLDFPIPPSCDAGQERSERFEATLANAEWALRNNRRADLLLYASLQCWDSHSAREATRAYARMSYHDRTFAGIAIGGLVPRLKDPDYVRSVIEAVRDEWTGPIHVFGVGNTELVRKCLGWGADSTDSSSYVKYAANGRSVNSRFPKVPDDQLTPLGRMHLALRNLAHLLDPTNDFLPLSAVGVSLALAEETRL